MTFPDPSQNFHYSTVVEDAHWKLVAIIPNQPPSGEVVDPPQLTTPEPTPPTIEVTPKPPEEDVTLNLVSPQPYQYRLMSGFNFKPV